MYKEFDIEHWVHREAYDMFTRKPFPHYLLAVNIDVTRLLEYKRREGLSFYLSIIYLMTKALNEQENFRLRVVDGRVVLYDRVEPNFTHKRIDEEMYHIYTARLEGSLPEFVRRTSEAIAGQTAFYAGDEPAPNLIYYSCAPTIECTCITNPGMSDPDDAIPRINWGRYTEREGRMLLNVSITVNHRFVDGFHVGRFVNRVQELIDELP